MRALAARLAASICLVGCGGGGAASLDLADSGDMTVDKAATCATTFGSALTSGFGRVDGTIHAVVPPNDPSCAGLNAGHLVLQVDSGGGTYRMVVNEQSDETLDDPDVRVYEVDAPLVGGAFAEGWHITSFDYVQSLAVHSPSFTPHSMSELTSLVTAELTIGAPVSVFSTTSGGSSTHLVHRNAPLEDGAIIVNPTTAPHWLLFSFSNQTF